MGSRIHRRIAVALAASVAVHALVASQLRWNGSPETVETIVARRERIVRWIVPVPSPVPTPPTQWSELDRSLLKKIRMTPVAEQIVVQQARGKDGRPSRAPQILRIEITPAVVRQRSVMHIRVLASSEATGVYIRFIIWQVGIPPVGAFRLPASDPDYPGRPYELFRREYEVPPVPWYARGKVYQVEVVATGRKGIASGAFVPIRVL